MLDASNSAYTYCLSTLDCLEDEILSKNAPGTIVREKLVRNMRYPPRNFFMNRIKIADQLHHQYKRSDYWADLDALLILCAVLGAASNQVWPGKRQDRLKFVELLIRYSKAFPSVKTISIPILMGKHRDKPELADLDPSSIPTQVLLSREIDKLENEVVKTCPSLDLKDIRSALYANLIYKYVRSGLMHSYALNGSLTDQDWLHPEELHYLNRGGLEKEGRRCLFIPYRYLRAVTLSVIDNLSFEWENSDRWETTAREPITWWLQF